MSKATKEMYAVVFFSGADHLVSIFSTQKKAEAQACKYLNSTGEAWNHTRSLSPNSVIAYWNGRNSYVSIDKVTVDEGDL